MVVFTLGWCKTAKIHQNEHSPGEEGQLKSPYRYFTNVTLLQDLVAFVHQQAEMLEEKSVTIDRQSALIRELQEETGVSLYFFYLFQFENTLQLRTNNEMFQKEERTIY